MKSQALRKLFIEFFKSKEHLHVPSSSLLPANDPTLLFNNAGMNQFKDYFLGQEKPHSPRATTCQKCIRAGGKHNDLENVGFTYRHLTFFEMLGNFSFGNYFKKEAIDFAWELIRDHLHLEEDKLWITIHPSDDEAYEYWLAHVKPERILRLEDNFWMMGPTGPCGPCSEIYYDRGPAFGKGSNPVEDSAGDRVIEFWNLVFMQYEQHADGTRTLLPKPSIDTGMGLERMVMLKNGVESVYETDVLSALMEKTQSLRSLSPPHPTALEKASLRVIADHIRTLSFAIADGIIPGPADRGYVLRKILRRAVRYGKKLGFDKPFLGLIVPTLVEEMGSDYPELASSFHRIVEILTSEEEQFLRTLARGGKLMQQVVDRSLAEGLGTISGHDAFSLYDTYGFPQDEIELFAKDHGLKVDLEEFNRSMEKARELSKKARGVVSQKLQTSLFENHLAIHPPSQFVGESELSGEGTILALVKEGQSIERIEEGDRAGMILDLSYFYAEKGGQVADTGFIEHQNALFEVHNVTAPFTGVLFIEGVVKKGAFLAGEPVMQKVDKVRRRKISANHTATHLLHKALELRLGSHVRQAGSLVDAEKLRFDFTHHQKLSPEDLLWIEKNVNEKIEEAHAVLCTEVPFESVQKEADIKQFFGEKYGAIVRVVNVEDVSRELCGGTHVKNTSQIRLFVIVGESSIAAGIRRIEAVTAGAACSLLMEMQDKLIRTAEKLQTTPALVLDKLDLLLHEKKTLATKLDSLSASKMAHYAKEIMARAIVQGDVKIMVEKVDCDSGELALIASQISKELKNFVLFLATSREKNYLTCRIDPSLPEKWNADILLKKALHALGGKGGGKRDAAQGAAPVGPDLSLAIAVVKEECNI